MFVSFVFSIEVVFIFFFFFIVVVVVVFFLLSGVFMAIVVSEFGKGDFSGINVKMEDILWLYRVVIVFKIFR